jgi:murein DD-endopeptidase MepM/ murein hydrolase activator NlpD
MKSRKLFVRILCVLLAFLMISGFIMMVIPVKAVTQADLQALEEKRAALEAKLSDQEKLVKSLNENHALIVERKTALDQQIALNRENIALMEAELAAYDELVTEKEAELTRAQTAQEKQTAAFRVRVRAMEEAGDTSLLHYIFQANSFSQLLSRLGDVSDIMHYDRKLEAELRTATAETARVKREYEQIYLAQSEVYSQLDEKKQELDAQVKAACALIATLDSQSKDAEKEYAAIEAAEQEAYKAEQEAYQVFLAEQYAAMLAAQQAAAAQSGAYSGGGNNGGAYGTAAGLGGFIWPVNSTYISSGYGSRTSPTAGASSYHQAIDISAAAGTPVYAAAAGKVTVATYNGGLGNYVTIAHSNGATTRYSHLTSFTVAAGQSVSQGQIIGYVGCTGIATGDHLDFAMTQGGQPVNPLDYFDQGGLTFGP